MRPVPRQALSTRCHQLHPANLHDRRKLALQRRKGIQVLRSEEARNRLPCPYLKSRRILSLLLERSGLALTMLRDLGTRAGRGRGRCIPRVREMVEGPRAVELRASSQTIDIGIILFVSHFCLFCTFCTQVFLPFCFFSATGLPNDLPVYNSNLAPPNYFGLLNVVCACAIKFSQPLPVRRLSSSL